MKVNLILSNFMTLFCYSEFQKMGFLLYNFMKKLNYNIFAGEIENVNARDFIHGR